MPGAPRDESDGIRAACCMRRPGRPSRQHLEGERQQRVAGQDRFRLAERLVRRRTPATQVVVVHGG
jgi:hypothetical protein